MLGKAEAMPASLAPLCRDREKARCISRAGEDIFKEAAEKQVNRFKLSALLPSYLSPCCCFHLSHTGL